MVTSQLHPDATPAPTLTTLPRQYIAYYESTGTYNQQNIALGRRNLNGGHPAAAGAWETFRFADYVQRTQDSHNTISLAVSSDGRIHLSYDHHDVPLNYRVSGRAVALDPAAVSSSSWSAALFGPTLHALPGAGSGPWRPVTYPRFERAGPDLLFELRIGSSGSGDSYLYRYRPGAGDDAAGSWAPVGRYIQGSGNNAYINGIDFTAAADDAKGSNATLLQVSWTWRETPDVVTNHDLCYARSADGGRTWRSSGGDTIGATIAPRSPGITVFAIPQNSGILNQEAQAADGAGGRFHVLNREKVAGSLTWMHYWRAPDGAWACNPVKHSLGALTQTGRRGKLAVHEQSGTLLAILAANSGNDVAVLAATPANAFKDWTEVWRGQGFDVEPLFDRYMWNGGGGVPGGKTLSLFTVTQGGYPARKVTVVDVHFG